MPYPNEHSCRLRDPGEFDGFARKNCDQKADGKCIDVIYGIKDGKSEIQALRYPKEIWEEDDARAHCEAKGGSFEAAKDEEQSKGEPSRLLTRQMPIDGRPRTLDEKTRSVKALICSEAPVRVLDPERWELVDEVLLTAEVVIERARLPLLDSHRREGLERILGSVSEFNPTDQGLEATLYFADTEEGRRAWTLVREGHLNGVSIGYLVLDAVWIPEGKTEAVAGRVLTGPLRVATRWALKEVSIVSIPADVNAAIRSADQEPSLGQGRYERMSEDTAIKTAREYKGLLQFAERLNIPRRILDDLLERVTSWNQFEEMARAAMLNYLVATAPQLSFRPAVDEHLGRIGLITDETDKRREAVIAGICLRAGLKKYEGIPGAREYANCTLLDVAKEVLQNLGVPVRRLSKHEVVSLALTTRAMTTGDFPALLAGAVNRVLRDAYDETPDTWRAWTKTTLAPDFRELRRVQMSELPSLEEIPEGAEYKYGTFGDSEEVFRVFTYGKLFAITRQAIINDDLGSLIRFPQAFGRAAKRLLGDLVYRQLTDNPVMSDGVALFHSSHGNLASSGAAPSEQTLGTALKALRLQKGLQDELIGVVPKFVIGPAALEVVIRQLLESTSIDEYNPGVKNIFFKTLLPIIEPRLDASSTAAWYVAADPATIDTVEVAFLNGQEGPYVESREGWTVDGIEYKVRLDVGVKAIDWRGLYKNPGA